jgi:hypothetical protein
MPGCAIHWNSGTFYGFLVDIALTFGDGSTSVRRLTLRADANPNGAHANPKGTRSAVALFRTRVTAGTPVPRSYPGAGGRVSQYAGTCHLSYRCHNRLIWPSRPDCFGAGIRHPPPSFPHDGAPQRLPNRRGWLPVIRQAALRFGSWSCGSSCCSCAVLRVLLVRLRPAVACNRSERSVCSDML